MADFKFFETVGSTLCWGLVDCGVGMCAAATVDMSPPLGRGISIHRKPPPCSESIDSFIVRPDPADHTDHTDSSSIALRPSPWFHWRRVRWDRADSRQWQHNTTSDSLSCNYTGYYRCGSKGCHHLAVSPGEGLPALPSASDKVRFSMQGCRAAELQGAGLSESLHALPSASDMVQFFMAVLVVRIPRFSMRLSATACLP